MLLTLHASSQLAFKKHLMATWIVVGSGDTKTENDTKLWRFSPKSLLEAYKVICPGSHN